MYYHPRQLGKCPPSSREKSMSSNSSSAAYKSLLNFNGLICQSNDHCLYKHDTVNHHYIAREFFLTIHAYLNIGVRHKSHYFEDFPPKKLIESCQPLTENNSFLSKFWNIFPNCMIFSKLLDRLVGLDMNGLWHCVFRPLKQQSLNSYYHNERMAMQYWQPEKSSVNHLYSSLVSARKEELW